MSFSFGGGSSGGRQSGTTTTTTTARALEAQEKNLLETQNEILQIELEQITRQNEALADIFPESKEILAGLTEATTKVVDVFGKALESLAATPAEREFRDVSEASALATLRGEVPVIGEEEQALLDRVFEVERRRGEEQILRFAENAAATRGMRLTDSPIGKPALEEVRRLNEGIGASKAAATLAFGQEQKQFREAVRQFQTGLQFQAQQNRLALTGMSPFALQAPMSTVTPAQAAGSVSGTLGALLGRPVSSTVTGSGRTSGRFDQWQAGADAARAAQGAGSLMLALGPAGAGVIGSTARVKRNILPLDSDEYDRALARVRETPLVRYRYVWERDEERAPHIGPILELSPEEIREDAFRLNVADFTGLVAAAVKGLDRKVTRLAIR